VTGSTVPGLTKKIPDQDKGKVVPFKSRKILFFVNELDFFLSHRYPVALAAQEAGLQVHVAGPRSAAVERITAAGFTFHHVPMTRSGASLGREARTVLRFYRLLRALQPDIVHNVALKAVLYGGIAAALARTPAVVNALTGLGYLFIAQDLKGRLLRSGIMLAFKLAFRQRRHRLILQNHDDPLLFLRAGVVGEGEIVVLPGSGVDMTAFSPAPEDAGAADLTGTSPGREGAGITVVLASRMLWDKGVGEFVAAAREHRRRGGEARFLLVGDSDPGNPACVPVRQLEEWHREGAVQWLGQRADVADIFARTQIVCLPSYREGLPKVLVEAAACGCAIVASDVPGCREIVRDGENGILVPARDGVALADAVGKLARDSTLRREMARRGRTLALAEFSVQRVVGETLSVYQELLA
jgi:glycosyltransferase involved in cell wall biosynthesis